MDQESSPTTSGNLSPLGEQVLKAAMASLDAAKRDPSRIDAAIEDLENQIQPLYPASVSRPPIGEDGVIISQEPGGGDVPPAEEGQNGL